MDSGERNERQPLPIEDYAMIGDCLTAALVGRDGSIDWLCWPYFDSDACFANLLGTSEHGRWLIGPADADARTARRYDGDTMILETVFETAAGRVALIDFMPSDPSTFAVIRRVEGRRGRVPMQLHLVLRFEYGTAMPWVTRLDDSQGIEAIAGPNRVLLRSDVPLRGDDGATVADFEVAEGQHVDFVLSWSRSHLPAPSKIAVDDALATTKSFWSDWSARCAYGGAWGEPVLRSLLTLKACSFLPTGAIVAAPTTSLPEQLGGTRNWDYRFCWLRDATLTLVALMSGGYYEEGEAWGQWLRRAVAGDPEELQIMYSIFGARRLTEWSPDWLPGYQNAAPVRIGNAASGQVQLDTYGELMGAIRVARCHGVPDDEKVWPIQVAFLQHLEKVWDQPDDGIWEVRGGRRHFTHSKVMAWVAVDSAIHDAETFELDAPLDEWRAWRQQMHEVICEKGYDAERNTFTQSFGSKALDASLLLIPQVGFLPADDPRMVGTIKAIEEDLVVDGFVLRYRTEAHTDGLPPGEGAFLPCSFWLAHAYALLGRMDEAEALFAKLLSLTNDLGLLAEEYDPSAKRLVGNFPQAYSHLALVATALALNGVKVAKLRGG